MFGKKPFVLGMPENRLERSNAACGYTGATGGLATAASRPRLPGPLRGSGHAPLRASVQILRPLCPATKGVVCP